MLTSLVVFVARKCQNIRKNDENSKYLRTKSSYPLNDLRNFSEIFRKILTIKCVILQKTAKNSVSPYLWNFFLEKSNFREIISTKNTISKKTKIKIEKQRLASRSLDLHF